MPCTCSAAARCGRALPIAGVRPGAPQARCGGGSAEESRSSRAARRFPEGRGAALPAATAAAVAVAVVRTPGEPPAVLSPR